MQNNIKISISGKGLCFDNIYIERLWRTIKHEDFYINCYEDGWVLECGLKKFIIFHNSQRPHQALGYKTPEEVYLN